MHYKKLYEGALRSYSFKITKPLRQLNCLLKKNYSRLIRLKYNANFTVRLLISLNFRFLIFKIKNKIWKENKIHKVAIIDDFLMPQESINLKYKKEIDIIIPIFNGLSFVKKLLNSIKKNTDLPYRLILINDKSTDPKMSRYLKAQLKYFKDAILINNDQNLGFIKSVNKSFAYVKSEFFILLNSDVEVPKDWLSRIIKPLTLDSKLASVTPFSNNATIFSFPEENISKNKFYKNFSLSEIDYEFSQFPLLNPLIKVPTGVGFCMGIQTKCVHEIGFFDEKFGKGYGEENDWCLRAINADFYHGNVNNLYVHHAQTKSFSVKERDLLIKKNLQLLNSRYPTYDFLIQDFIKQDSLRLIKNLAGFKLQENKKNILIIDHDIGGGANHYRNELIQSLLNKGRGIILLTDNAISGMMHLNFYTKNYKFMTRLKDVRLFENLFKLFVINEVIYNNGVNFNNSLLLIKEILVLKKQFKFQITTLFHDFYPICPSYTLIDKDGKYCGIPKNINVCEGCVNKLNPIYSGILGKNNNILEWRNVWGSFIKLSENIICFSNSSREIILKAYPFAKKNLKVIPHSIKWTPSKIPAIQKHKLHIGIIGGINYAKGAFLINELVDHIERDRLGIKVTLLGEIDPYFYNTKINILGNFKKSELPDLIEKNEINIILMPSICPETFSYVVSEIIKMNLPLIAFELGAQGEKVKAYKNGLVLPLTLSIEDIFKSIVFFSKRFFINS